MRALLLARVNLTLAEWNGLSVEDQAALVVAGHELNREQAELVALALARLLLPAEPAEPPAKPAEPKDRSAVLAALERAAIEAQNAHAQVGAS